MNYPIFQTACLPGLAIRSAAKPTVNSASNTPVTPSLQPFGRPRFGLTSPNREAALAQFARLQALPISEVVDMLERDMSGCPLGTGGQANVYGLSAFPNLVVRADKTRPAATSLFLFDGGKWKTIDEKDKPLLDIPTLMLPRLVLAQGDDHSPISLFDALNCCSRPSRLAFMEKAAGRCPSDDYEEFVRKIIPSGDRLEQGERICDTPVDGHIILSAELKRRIDPFIGICMGLSKQQTVQLAVDFLHQCREGTWQPDGKSPYKTTKPSSASLRHFYNNYRQAVEAYLDRIEQIANLPKSAFEGAANAIFTLSRMPRPVSLDFTTLRNTLINWQTHQIEFIDPQDPSQVFVQRHYQSPLTAFVGVLLGQRANNEASFPLGLLVEPDDQARFQQATEKLFDKIRQAAQAQDEVWDPKQLRTALNI